MAILEKEAFMNLIKERIGDSTTDEDLKFIEDLTDTYNDLEQKSNTASDKEWEEKYNNLDKEWREKYKARFFNSETTPAGVKDEQEEDVKDDAEEKTYADLFEEREG